MLPIIGDNLKNELAAIEAGDPGGAFKKHLPVLRRLIKSNFCVKAWTIAAENKYNSLDGQIYLAVAILSALVLGEKNFDIRAEKLNKAKITLQSTYTDSERITKVIRKIGKELPWSSKKSGKYWPRTCFVHLTGLALYKLDHKIHAPEVRELTNTTGKFDVIDGNNVRRLLASITDELAEAHTANLTTIISLTPHSKK